MPTKTAVSRISSVFYDFFFNDDDKDDYNEKLNSKHYPKVEGYAELVVPRQLNNQFKAHFRMERSTFNNTLERQANNYAFIMV